jgi:hypothetical protein
MSVLPVWSLTARTRRANHQKVFTMFESEISRSDLQPSAHSVSQGEPTKSHEEAPIRAADPSAGHSTRVSYT